MQTSVPEIFCQTRELLQTLENAACHLILITMKTNSPGSRFIKVIVFVNCYCCELWIECDGCTWPGDWSALHWGYYSVRGEGVTIMASIPHHTPQHTECIISPPPQYNAQNMAAASLWYNRIRLKVVHHPRSFFGSAAKVTSIQPSFPLWWNWLKTYKSHE